MFDRSRYEPKRLIMGSLRAMVRGFSPADVSTAEAASLVDWFGEIERLATAGKALAAHRAAEGGEWRAAGDRSPADWLAKRTGSTVGRARAALDTAAHLDEAPATDAAFRGGELSLEQAQAVAAAATADPAAESRLLEMARHQSLQKLRDESARVRAAADRDAAARHERIRRSRSWRRWTDADGARCGSYRLTPEDAAVLEVAAQPFIDAAIDHARRTGDHEPSDAYAADGLVAMAASTTRGGTDNGAESARGGRGRRRLRNRRELIGIVNLESLRRGSAGSAETCEIAGVGPVPVDVARDVFGDALLRIVIRDGNDIRTVVHTGRTASAVQETAVLVRDGGRCRRPRCDLPISEIDHVAGYATTHTTTLDDLVGLCGHDHDLKTRSGHRYRLDAEGHVAWTRPDGTIEYERPPP